MNCCTLRDTRMSATFRSNLLDSVLWQRKGQCQVDRGISHRLV